MKQAIISDIHSNLEAFQAVLADMDAQGVDEVYCLGDLIGYGPNPKECVDLAMKPETKIKVCHPSQGGAATLFLPPSRGLPQDLEWVGECSWVLSPGWAHQQGHMPSTGLPACHPTVRASPLNAEVLSASGVSLLKCESPWEGYGLSANT